MADHLLIPTVTPWPRRRQRPRTCPAEPKGPAERAALQVQDDVGARLGAADQHLAAGGLLQRVRAVADVAGQQRSLAGVAHAGPAGVADRDITGVGELEQA